jgi:hypothetical protein
MYSLLFTSSCFLLVFGTAVVDTSVDTDIDLFNNISADDESDYDTDNHQCGMCFWCE